VEVQVWAEALRPTLLTPAPFMPPKAPRGKLAHATVWRVEDSRVGSLWSSISGSIASPSSFVTEHFSLHLFLPSPHMYYYATGRPVLVF